MCISESFIQNLLVLHVNIIPWQTSCRGGSAMKWRQRLTIHSTSCDMHESAGTNCTKNLGNIAGYIRPLLMQEEEAQGGCVRRNIQQLGMLLMRKPFVIFRTTQTHDGFIGKFVHYFAGRNRHSLYYGGVLGFSLKPHPECHDIHRSAAQDIRRCD